MQKHHSTDNDIMIFLEHLKFVLNGALPEVKATQTTFYQNFVTKQQMIPCMHALNRYETIKREYWSCHAMQENNASKRIWLIGDLFLFEK